MDFGWCDIWEGWVSPFNHNSIPLFLTSILWNVLWSFENLKADYFPFWFWTDGIRIHPGCPSYLAGILKSGGKQGETRKDYLKTVNLANWNTHHILKFSGDGNLRCIGKWLALSNQHHQRAIDPSLVNDKNAERIIGLGQTEHTALIIPRACQNMEGRFIVEAKSTGKIFLILISLFMIKLTHFCCWVKIEILNCRCNWMKNCKQKWLKQCGMRKSRISKSFCLCLCLRFYEAVNSKIPSE